MSNETGVQYETYVSPYTGVVRGGRHIHLYQPIPDGRTLPPNPTVSEVIAFTQNTPNANIPFSAIARVVVNGRSLWHSRFFHPAEVETQESRLITADQGVVRLELLLGQGETADVRVQAVRELAREVREQAARELLRLGFTKE